MVFYGLAAGLVFGVTFPMYCDEYIYLFMASTFLRPHLKFKMEQEKRHKDLAIRVDHIDAYTRDIFKSFLFFTLAAPFIFYRVYWKREDLFKPRETDIQTYETEDSAVTLLKQIKSDQITDVVEGEE